MGEPGRRTRRHEQRAVRVPADEPHRRDPEQDERERAIECLQGEFEGDEPHERDRGGVHAIEPLGYRASREDAMEAIARIVAGMDGARIVARSDDYLYAEFETAWLGFVDDVEFYAPPETKVVHVRSASRLGHSDLGVNRRRVETIRARFAEQGL